VGGLVTCPVETFAEDQDETTSENCSPREGLPKERQRVARSLNSSSSSIPSPVRGLARGTKRGHQRLQLRELENHAQQRPRTSNRKPDASIFLSLRLLSILSSFYPSTHKSHIIHLHPSTPVPRTHHLSRSSSSSSGRFLRFLGRRRRTSNEGVLSVKTNGFPG